MLKNNFDCCLPNLLYSSNVSFDLNLQTLEIATFQSLHDAIVKVNVRIMNSASIDNCNKFTR